MSRTGNRDETAKSGAGVTNMSRRQPGEKSGSVAVHIYGGLGNQLFQYACGRALALRRGAAFRIDNRDFSAGTGQLYGLHHFNIVDQSDQTGILPPSRSELLRYLVWRYLKLPPTFIREQGAAFDPDILSLSGDNLLHGYWQSERYFEDCGELIRNELTIATPPSQKNRQISDEIGSLPAVSMHVRRGDYVTNPKALFYHGVCSVEYYRKAAQHMAENMVGEPVFYVFSDDPDWAREHLDLPFETRIIDHNDSEHNYEDLRLMAACRHHIIANSSFSWWGAWLNPSPEKIVVAPARWVSDPANANPHITPQSWIRMEG